ncbi:hypothetical protein OF83DRAFT_692539 [Amylostereum chailletii]|nr:hypothetical protein OF83DRAFT_692539 [Amylostereum chailletii]
MHDTPTIKRRPSATDLLPTKHVITKNLRSRDGIPIYADAIGNPSRPPLVFVHGSGVSGAVFNHIFQDSRYNSEFYMVNNPPRSSFAAYEPIGRSDTT